MDLQIGDLVRYIGEGYTGPLGLGTVMWIDAEDDYPIKVQFSGQVAPDRPLACLPQELEKVDF